MTIRNVCFGMTAAVALIAIAIPALAQEYPNKPIKIISPYAPGPTDMAAHIFRERLAAKWGQTIIIEHRPGASGNIGLEAVYKAPADGYTLLFFPTPALTAKKHLYKSLPFDTEAFTPISLISETPFVLVAHPKLQVQTVQQLIAAAKADPGGVSYASIGEGGAAHLAAELFQTMTGTKLNKSPFAGSAPGTVALLGGHVDTSFTLLSTALPNIRAGQLRAIAVASEKRSPLLPDVPALAETLPGFFATSPSGFAGPPKLPAALANNWSAAIAEIMREPQIVKQFLEVSAVAIGSTPAELAAFMKRESDLAGQTIRKIGLTLD